MATRQDQVVGVMPLMSGHGEFGEVLNSLPYFGSNGGPLVTSEEAADALLSWYEERVDRDGVAAATVVENPLSPSQAPRHELAEDRVAHVTDLTGPDACDERVWRMIDGSARRNVKKTQRLGTVVAVENEAFPELEALHRAAMGAIGAQAKDPEFFTAVQRHFRPGEDFDLFVARLDGEPAGALLIFYSASAVDYYIPAASPEHRSAQPMAAVLLAALTQAAERGLEHWNWGGSRPDQDALMRFKAKWGGRPHPYRYWTAVKRPELLDASPEALLAAYPGFFVVPFAALRSRS
jgi:lipid II:glycine glycyltransferase (peptidoglycan interpeptide bridge formation enzyme)